MKIVDAHCHLYGFEDFEIEKIFSELDIIIVAVSEDLESAERVLEISKRFSNSVVPCIGLHPWNISKGFEDSFEEIIKMGKYVKCFGEIGLDNRFNKDNFTHQLKAFEMFLDEASRKNYVLNLHALDAWWDVLRLLKRYDIEKAIFHWYSGPINVLKEIEENNYFITINPSISFQKKHRRALENIGIENILTESDGPYNYKGRVLKPNMIPETIKIIGDIKKVEEDRVIEVIYGNFIKLFG